MISHGSVLGYHHPNGAIVNASNKGCLGGGGVDAAISSAGGRALYLDRRPLPVLRSVHRRNIRDRDSLGSFDLDPIRYFTGDAVITAPNTYGSIGVPNVIHVVGPAYYNYDNFDEPDELLYEAYMRSLERANDAQL